MLPEGLQLEDRYARLIFHVDTVGEVEEAMQMLTRLVVAPLVEKRIKVAIEVIPTNSSEIHLLIEVARSAADFIVQNYEAIAVVGGVLTGASRAGIWLWKKLTGKNETAAYSQVEDYVRNRLRTSVQYVNKQYQNDGKFYYDIMDANKIEHRFEVTKRCQISKLG